MKIITLAVSAGLATSALCPLADAQTVQPYRGEMVMSAEGATVAPWKESRNCSKKDAPCRIIVWNPASREIAGIDGKWSSRFTATGNGKEVVRAEKAIAKAQREKGIVAMQPSDSKR